MSSVFRLSFPHDWGRARCADSQEAIEHFRHHAELSVRVGLLENPHVSTDLADEVAMAELGAASDAEALAYVRREVARSKRVSPAVLTIVSECGAWEVWAILLHNLATPKDVLEFIATFTSENEKVQKEFAYLVKRAQERLSGDGNVV